MEWEWRLTTERRDFCDFAANLKHHHTKKVVPLWAIGNRLNINGGVPRATQNRNQYLFLLWLTCLGMYCTRDGMLVYETRVHIISSMLVLYSFLCSCFWCRRHQYPYTRKTGTKKTVSFQDSLVKIFNHFDEIGIDCILFGDFSASCALISINNLDGIIINLELKQYYLQSVALSWSNMFALYQQ